jgi:hypothetical protein
MGWKKIRLLLICLCSYCKELALLLGKNARMQAKIVELALSWKEARMQASIMSIAYLLCTLSWKECYNASKHHGACTLGNMLECKQASCPSSCTYFQGIRVSRNCL